MDSNSKYHNLEPSTTVVTATSATPVVPHASASPSATPYLEVIAPATLPEGYTFEAEVNARWSQRGTEVHSTI